MSAIGLATTLMDVSKKGTAVEQLICILRVLAVKMLESTDLFSVVPQFLWWEDSGMILV